MLSEGCLAVSKNVKYGYLACYLPSKFLLIRCELYAGFYQNGLSISVNLIGNPIANWLSIVFAGLNLYVTSAPWADQPEGLLGRRPKPSLRLGRRGFATPLLY